MRVYTITLERISTGERSPSLVWRGETEKDAVEYAENAIAEQLDANDYRVVCVTSREG